MGFSSTFWDTLFGSCPPCTSRLTLPLPFLDFALRPDLYDRNREALERGWDEQVRLR